MSRFTKILYFIVAVSILIMLVSCGNEAPETTDALQQTDAPQTDAPQTDAPHVHNFVDEVIPASCIAEGKITPKCSCGETSEEVVIPKVAHIAKEVNCEADTLCGVCGTVIAPATGHKMLTSEILSKATCTTSGNVVAICSVCGKEENMISPPTDHSFNKNTKWSVSNGVYTASSNCTICNKNTISESDTPAFFLDFESPISDSATKYAGFRIVKPDNYDASKVDSNGSLGLKVVSSSPNIFYIDVDAEKLMEMGSVSISFDMTLLTDGKSGKEPSLFSLLGNFQNGSSTGSTRFGWLFKFKNDESKLEIVQGKPLTDSNSILLEKGVTYKINILLNMQTGNAEIFVNGKSVGISQNSYAYIKNNVQSQNLSFRFGDGSMPETVFDNIRISTAK